MKTYTHGDLRAMRRWAIVDLDPDSKGRTKRPAYGWRHPRQGGSNGRAWTIDQRTYYCTSKNPENWITYEEGLEVLAANPRRNWRLAFNFSALKDEDNALPTDVVLSEWDLDARPFNEMDSEEKEWINAIGLAFKKLGLKAEVSASGLGIHYKVALEATTALFECGKVRDTFNWPFKVQKGMKFAHLEIWDSRESNGRYIIQGDKESRISDEEEIPFITDAQLAEALPDLWTFATTPIKDKEGVEADEAEVVDLPVEYQCNAWADAFRIMSWPDVDLMEVGSIYRVANRGGVYEPIVKTKEGQKDGVTYIGSLVRSSTEYFLGKMKALEVGTPKQRMELRRWYERAKGRNYREVIDLLPTIVAHYEQEEYEDEKTSFWAPIKSPSSSGINLYQTPDIDSELFHPVLPFKDGIIDVLTGKRLPVGQVLNRNILSEGFKIPVNHSEVVPETETSKLADALIDAWIEANGKDFFPVLLLTTQRGAGVCIAGSGRGNPPYLA